MDTAEIILYQPDEESIQIKVRIDDETVWLSQSQMVELFDSTKQNISLHINNIYNERELSPVSTVKEYLTVQVEGARKTRRKLKHYNLDVIISVGYRVKSLRGTQFRIWANKVLKDYLLKGYAINQKIERIERKLIEYDEKFDLIIKSSLLPDEGIFYDGQIFDAWKFASSLIKSATESIKLLDNFVDENVLVLLSKRDVRVSATIYTSNISKQLRTDLKKFNDQYPAIDIVIFSKSHDRFLIIDETNVYHIGASLKDLGKKWFAFSKIDLDAREMIKRLHL
jgi:hypothetical protein